MVQVLNFGDLYAAVIFCLIKYCPVERVEIVHTNNYRNIQMPVLEFHNAVIFEVALSDQLCQMP